MSSQETTSELKRAIMATCTVLVPYVAGMLCPQTTAAVIGYTYPVHLIPIPAEDPFRYAALMRVWWASPFNTIIVEQDMVPPAGSLDRLVMCPEPWCTLPYLISGRIETAALGTAKFSGALKEGMPDIATVAARNHNGKGSPMTWRSLDASLAKALYARGLHPHVHYKDQAIHLHDYAPQENS